MLVQQATPAQIKAHLAACKRCMADQVLLVRLDLLSEATTKDDDCEARFLGGQVDERVADLHGGYINAPA